MLKPGETVLPSEISKSFLTGSGLEAGSTWSISWLAFPEPILRYGRLSFGLERGRRILDEFTQDFMTEDDFAYLKSHNINLIRVPFRYNMFIDDNGDRVPDGYRYIDRLMRMAEKYEIYVLPDLHTAPGGQNPDWHSDNQTGYTGFWRFCALQDMVVDMWDDLSKHLSDEKYLLGYDVLNEPFIIPALLTGKEDTDDCATGARMEGSVQILRNFYHRVLAAVRKNDSNHIVFFEGDHFASDFNGLDDFEDPQVALTFMRTPIPEKKERQSSEKSWTA